MQDIHLCRYENEADYWRIRAFLRDVMIANDLRQWSWHVARLDYWRWHVMDNSDAIADMAFMWQTSDNEIAAVLVAEEMGQVYFQVHPAHRNAALEAQMLDTAEAHLLEDNQLVVHAHSEDTARSEMLQSRGYVRGEWAEYQWRRDLDAPIPSVSAASGYTVRSMGDTHENPARSWCSWRAFHPDEPDSAYDGHEWFALNFQRQPLYRRDLDLIAVPDGDPFEVAAFTTIWYDDVTRTGYFEPVGTAPEHQRRGLARALLTEGLGRVQRLGGKRAFVGGYSVAANALYRSVFSGNHDIAVPWIKTG